MAHERKYSVRAAHTSRTCGPPAVRVSRQARQQWVQFALVNYHLAAKNYTLALQLMQILCEDGAR